MNPELTAAGSRQASAGVPRIAFVTDIVTPFEVAELAALAEISDLTAVFCSDAGTRGMNWKVELPFRHEVVGGLTVPRRSRDATDLYLSPRIVGALHRARPEVVIVGAFSIPSVYAALYCRLRRIPLLVHSDGTPETEANLSAQQRAARGLMLRLAWGAVANSQAAADQFHRIGFAPKRILHAPHAADVEPLWRISETRVQRTEGPLALLSVGRLIALKGYDLLLKALGQARGAGADVELVVVGSGPEEASLRALAAELGVPVSWRGFLDPSELPAVYAAADVFAFPTLSDTFGIVLLEAAAAGLPLIASPHAGATLDLVTHGLNGFVVEPSDTTALADAIGRLAGDPDLRSEMGVAARESTRNRTPAACATGYLKAVQAALAASGT